MGKIIQLDDQLSNKIAAGEVVERPASVIKELVENAIDANSTIIEVEVEEAGLAKIRVIDNGDGMEADDVKKAFSRHATSKIKDENDLFRIQTLGFRGEALPSIAAVAKVELMTSTGANVGSRLVLEGGKQVVFEAAPSRKGTDFTVSDLFYNTPARLKYMKSIHTELGNITDTINRLALAHPEIAMKLTHNGRVLLKTPGNGDAKQVLASIYGLKIVKKMIPLEASSLDFHIKGYIALPEITRASRNYISTMVNGRFIKNYGLANAIVAGYHTLLPIGRYPIVFLHIEMDPILIDVNVHPAKLEVRLSKEQALFELVTSAIRNAFKKETLIPTGKVMTNEKQASEQIKFELDHLPLERGKHHLNHSLSKKEQLVGQQLLNEATQFIHKQPFHSVLQIKEEAIESQNGIKIHPNFEETGECDTVIKEELNNTVMTSHSKLLETEEKASADDYQLITNEELSGDCRDISENKSSRLPPLYPIGQMHGTYIFAQNENGLYIIDQHAAQERIKYEFFRKKIGEVTNDLQELLIPITLQFTNDESVKIEEHLQELKLVGVFLEPFGGNTFLIRNHPTWFPKGEEEETIRLIIDQLLSMKKIDIHKLREDTAIMMSCKGSIKANHHLRQDEILALLDTLRQAEDPFTCPHGRPVIIHYSNYDMEKMFKRVM